MGWAAIAGAMMLAQAVAEPAQPSVLTAPAGPEVELMVLGEVSGTRARIGDTVRLELFRPLVEAGRVLLPAGTPAFGEVTALEKSGMGMKRGRLAVRLIRVVWQGRDLALATELDARGRGGKSDDAVKLLFAPIYAPFAMGNSAKFKAGDIVRARLVEPLPAGTIPPAG